MKIPNNQFTFINFEIIFLLDKKSRQIKKKNLATPKTKMYKETSNQSSLDLKSKKILTNINDSIGNFKIIANESDTVRESDSDTPNSNTINHLKKLCQQFGASNKRDRQFVESKKKKRGEAKVTSTTCKELEILISYMNNPPDTEQGRKEVNMLKNFVKQWQQSRIKRHSPEPIISLSQPLKKVFRDT